MRFRRKSMWRREGLSRGRFRFSSPSAKNRRLRPDYEEPRGSSNLGDYRLQDEGERCGGGGWGFTLPRCRFKSPRPPRLSCPGGSGLGKRGETGGKCWPKPISHEKSGGLACPLASEQANQRFLDDPKTFYRRSAGADVVRKFRRSSLGSGYRVEHRQM